MADEQHAEPVRSAAAVKAAPKEKGKSKGKKGAKGTSPTSDGGLPTLAAHPRAVRGVARAKAWGGLAGFALGGYLSYSTHTLADTGLRALAAGVVCYVAAWAVAVFLWRRLVAAELSHARQERVASELAKLASTSGGAPSSSG